LSNFTSSFSRMSCEKIFIIIISIIIIIIDIVYELDERGSTTGRDKGSSLHPSPRPNRLWSSPSLLSNEDREFFFR
jgi:hypothetical protein